MEGKEKISGEWLGSFEAYQDWFDALQLNSRKGEISNIMRKTYDSNLRNFIRFLRAGGDQEATPDSIVAWARDKSDAKKGRDVIVLLNKFSHWLQGKDVKGYKKRVPLRKGKFINQGSADNISHGTIRGLFSHNQILLPKSGRKKRSSRSAVRKNDENFAIFKPGKNDKEVADFELLRQFLSTLNIHDQTIIMSMLSTSQDPGDVLSLNIGFVTNQPEGERLYWEGERGKNGEDFRTFFSKEASGMVRRYVKQERKGAGEDDPLFVRTMGQRITPKHLSENSRNVAEKMGLINGKTQNPFRPKRMRSIFRSACSIAGIDKGYINIFMGHKTDVSDGYLEKPRATLELRYGMVEQYLTVFSGESSQDIAEMKEQVSKYSARAQEYSERQDQAFDFMFRLEKENTELKTELNGMRSEMDKQEHLLQLVIERMTWLEGETQEEGEWVKDEDGKIRFKFAEELKK